MNVHGARSKYGLTIDNFHGQIQQYFRKTLPLIFLGVFLGTLLYIHLYNHSKRFKSLLKGSMGWLKGFESQLDVFEGQLEELEREG